MKPVRKILDTEISFKILGDQPVCSVLVTRASLLDWIAVLWLILEEMGSVVIPGKKDSKCLVSLGLKSSIVQEGDMLKVQLNKNDITCVASYLLRYFRDGFAEVDHVDIDAVFQNQSGYITFKVNEYSAPISEGEARRRLGL